MTEEEKRRNDERINELLDQQLRRIQGMTDRADDKPWTEWPDRPEDRAEDRIRIVIIHKGQVVEDYIPENRLRIHTAQLREALMMTMGVKAEGRAAFNSRIKNVLNLGLLGKGVDVVDGRREYRLVDALELAVVIMLQRAYVPQSVAVDFVIDHRDTLDSYWDMLRASAKPPFGFVLSMEGLLPTGNDDRSNKRGNRGGRNLDTVKLIPGRRIRPGASLAPTISIDLPDLVATFCSNLIKTGISEAVIKEARLALPGRVLGYMGDKAVEWSRYTDIPPTDNAFDDD